MAKKDTLHIRIDGDLKESVRKEAKKQNRTMANFVETALIKAVQSSSDK